MLRLTDAIGGIGNLLGGAGNLAVANHVEHLEETECLFLSVFRRIACTNHAAAVGFRSKHLVTGQEREFMIFAQALHLIVQRRSPADAVSVALCQGSLVVGSG